MPKTSATVIFVLAVTLVLPVQAEELQIATYNVHNLFDSRHDAGKNDYEFLPEANQSRQKYCDKILSGSGNRDRRAERRCQDPIDWTSSKVQLKISQIKKVFSTRGHLTGKFPDILMLSEVENRYVVKSTAEKLGYDKFVMTEGPDKRGIDVAFLFKGDGPLKLVKTKSHRVGTSFPTRPILEAEFWLRKTDGSSTKIFFYANHWPAGGPRGAGPRLIAAKTLKSLIVKRSLENRDAMFFAMGDFNVNPRDYPHPLNDELLKSSPGRVKLVDVHTKYIEDVRAGRVPEKAMPEGSYYYHGNRSWQILDRFIVSNNLLDRQGIELDLRSYQIYGPKFISKRVSGKSVPKSYRHRSSTARAAGFSDHYPVFVSIRY